MNWRCLRPGGVQAWLDDPPGWRLALPIARFFSEALLGGWGKMQNGSGNLLFAADQRGGLPIRVMRPSGAPDLPEQPRFYG